jgi:hypothetical protein
VFLPLPAEEASDVRPKPGDTPPPQTVA